LFTIGNPPCDVGIIRSRRADTPCEETSRPWVLAATTIGSAMALGARAADSQWIVESYALFLSTLILAAAKHRRGEENWPTWGRTVPV
jgi:hypothetical protein